MKRRTRVFFLLLRDLEVRGGNSFFETLEVRGGNAGKIIARKKDGDRSTNRRKQSLLKLLNVARSSHRHRFRCLYRRTKAGSKGLALGCRTDLALGISHEKSSFAARRDLSDPAKKSPQNPSPTIHSKFRRASTVAALSGLCEAILSCHFKK